MLASTFLLDGLTSKVSYDFSLYASLAVLALVAGFIIGGLATGLTLMIVGVPVARLAGAYLEKPEGIITGIVTAVICVMVFNAIGDPNEPFWMLAAGCFAVPAALLYRRQMLLERAFDRP